MQNKKLKNDFNKDKRWERNKIKESPGPGFYDP